MVTDWSDFFVAAAGAAAALAGLLFVSVSINLERILALPGVPDRAFETLLLLLSVVVVALLGLVADQSSVALGVELVVVGAGFGLGILRLAARNAGTADTRLHGASRILLPALGTIPIVIGGGLLAFDAGAGLYWVAAGIVAAIAGGVLNAWVLLIEIHR